MNSIEELNTAINKKRKENGISESIPIRVDSIPFNKKNQVIEGIYLDVELDDVYNPYTSEMEKIKVVVIKSK